MEHVFTKGSDESKPVLLLLHGTGGNERDLLPLAEIVDREASVLGVRGNVLEQGMPRFFKRLAEGIFDEADLRFRTQELNAFLNEAAETYQFDRNNVVAIGYSNGANIAASLLFHFEDALAGAILHHPMVPIRGITLPNLAGVPVLITAGENDPLCSAQESKELDTLLAAAGAVTEVHWERNGHTLTRTEVEAAATWYAKQFK